VKKAKVKKQKTEVKKGAGLRASCAVDLSSVVPCTFLRFCLLTFAFCLLPFAFACGKRRPPLAPVERVPQRTEALSGAQRGNRVFLEWPAPQRNAPDTSVQSIRRIDVYRLAERPDAPLPLTEEQFSTRATLIGSVTYETIRNAPGGVINYVDTLELAGEPTRLRYALRYVNAAGQRAGFSNFLLIEPAARIAQPPTLTGPAEVSETAITIRWQPPTANIDDSTPVNLLGYNIYRFDQSQAESGQTPINTTLVSGTEFADKNFRFGSRYNYIVRAVSLGTNGAQVESLNSNTVAAEPRDVFPPAAPGRVTAAAAPGRISLFFPANTETDVAGYVIYRSADASLPLQDWTKLNDQLWTRTTFQDETVEAGKRYYYYVRAVDNSGNVSPPSEVVSETVP
jgi:hypothetical protein